MHLDELAGLEIQRLAVVAQELVMANGRRQHAAVDQFQGELDWHGGGNSV